MNITVPATGALYVTIVRNTPLTLVFLFFVFAYPYLDIIEMSFFTAAVVALSVYTSAFICEVVRSGINTVPLGQAEAARALGLTTGQSLSQIILPRALRSVVPPLVRHADRPAEEHDHRRRVLRRRRPAGSARSCPTTARTS